jgi:ubiquitin C-terminal hydrolase
LTKSFEVLETVIRSHHSCHIAASSLAALAENSLHLNLGLLTAADDGSVIFVSGIADCVHSANESWMVRLFRSLCLFVPSSAVRHTSCRRIFDACANIWIICTDGAGQLPQDKKAERIRLFDRLYDTVIAAAYVELSLSPKNPAKELTERFSGHTEQLYTLFACMQAVQSLPELFVPNYPTNTMVARLEQNFIHGDVQQMADPLSSQDLHRREDMLCQKFVQKLFRHKSTESFHSTKPDPCVVGILRVLLVLSSVPTQQITMGNAKVASDDVNVDPNAGPDLLTFLFINCLFPISSTNASSRRSSVLGPICQTPTSRSLVYALLFMLCKSNVANYGRLIAIMSNEANESTVVAIKPSDEHTVNGQQQTRTFRLKQKPWNYNPAALVKNSDAYVGLCNQGGTCYMNSLLQQLYHTPSFSSGLLQIESKLSEGKDQDSEKVLFQLQVLFGFLRLSQKRYYDTLPFCKVFKDYDGEPIRLGEQKDINEFAGMLFDKLESNPDVAGLLARTIQGTFVYKTKSIETPYKSDREEKFYMITVDVKNKNTLEESLELNIAEELFSGENKLEDPDAGRKVDALRRCAVRQLPPTLIIHLKRFEFDLETMNRKKVNDLITFPVDLNMYPYTEEGIAAKDAKLKSRNPEMESSAEDVMDSVLNPHFKRSQLASEVNPRDPSSPYYQYVLKGIVAHMGAIDSGHYYSFIKDKATGKWFEYNDKAVLSFSPNDIPTEVSSCTVLTIVVLALLIQCFGGEEMYTMSTGAQGLRMRQNNAYLLFYERSGPDCDAEDVASSAQHMHIPSPPKSVLTLPDGVADARSALNFSESVESALAPLAPLSNIASNVMQAVWTENIEFQTDRYLFEATHFKFLWQLLHAESLEVLLKRTNSSAGKNDGDPHSKLSVMVLRFVVEVVCRARAQSCVQLFFGRLEKIVSSDSSGRCADAVIQELSHENADYAAAFAMVSTVTTPRARANSIGGSGPAASVPSSTTVTLSRRTQTEKQVVQRSVHSWLLQMYLLCPHSVSVRIFSKFLLVCFKVIRNESHTHYLERDPSLCCPDIGVGGMADCIAPCPKDHKDELETDSNDAASNAVLPVTVDSRVFSCVSTRFVYKLLLLLVCFQPDDIVGHDGEFFS